MGQQYHTAHSCPASASLPPNPTFETRQTAASCLGCATCYSPCVLSIKTRYAKARPESVPRITRILFASAARTQPNLRSCGLASTTTPVEHTDFKLHVSVATIHRHALVHSYQPLSIAACISAALAPKTASIVFKLCSSKTFALPPFRGPFTTAQ
jgi:hypothetical protein